MGGHIYVKCYLIRGVDYDHPLGSTISSSTNQIVVVIKERPLLIIPSPSNPVQLPLSLCSLCDQILLRIQSLSLSLSRFQNPFLLLFQFQASHTTHTITSDHFS